jgi:hypothetical protein
LLTTTDAPGTAAPDGSSTRPCSTAIVCALASDTVRSNSVVWIKRHEDCMNVLEPQRVVFQ